MPCPTSGHHSKRYRAPPQTTESEVSRLGALNFRDQNHLSSVLSVTEITFIEAYSPRTCRSLPYLSPWQVALAQ